MNTTPGKTISEDAAVAALGLIHSYRLSSDAGAPMFILVHGRAGDCSVMWAFNRTIPEQANVIAVQAPYPDSSGGFSWWSINDRERGALERGESLGTLRRFIADAPRFYNLTPSKVIAYGFSQGAVLLSMLAQEEPGTFSALALLAGFVKRSEIPVSGMPPVFIAHGTQDETVPVERAREGVQYLQSLGAQVEYHEEPVGHKIGAASMRALKEWAHRTSSSALS